jgi:hypothetical protein
VRLKAPGIGNYHGTTRRTLLKTASPAAVLPCTIQDESIDTIYSLLLLPFADVFCMFSADIGGFRQIARHLAVWLKKA